jgi:hypothetical protein
MSLPSSEHFARSQFITALTADTRKATTDGAAVAITAPVLGDAASYYLHSSGAAFFIMGAAAVTDPTIETGVPIAGGQFAGPLKFESGIDTVKIINDTGASGFASLIRVS